MAESPQPKSNAALWGRSAHCCLNFRNNAFSLREMGSIDHHAVDLEPHPQRFPQSRNNARCAQERSASVGVKRSLMMPNLRRMNGGFGGKSVPSRGIGLTGQPGGITKVGVHGIDGGYAGHARGVQAQIAGEHEWRRIVPLPSRLALAPSATDKSSPPHSRPVSRGCDHDLAASDSVAAGVSVQIAIISFRLALRGLVFRDHASRRSRSCGPAALGNMMPSGRAAITASRSSRHHSRAQRIDPDVAQASVRTFGQRVYHEPARFAFRTGTDRIFDIENGDIRAAHKAFRHHLGGAARSKQ